MRLPKTAAVLLAAGRSSRMGQLKALLPWRGQPLIQYQIEQMKQAAIDEVIVVLGHQAEQLKKCISSSDIRMVINENYKLGKSSSIRKGISCIEENVQGIFVSAVDQPVPASVFIEMNNCLKSTNAQAVIPIYNGKRGHPILFNGCLHKELLFINEETKGLRSVIQKVKDQISYLEVNDSSVLINLNHPEDYIKAGGS